MTRFSQKKKRTCRRVLREIPRDFLRLGKKGQGGRIPWRNEGHEGERAVFATPHDRQGFSEVKIGHLFYFPREDPKHVRVVLFPWFFVI